MRHDDLSLPSSGAEAASARTFGAGPHGDFTDDWQRRLNDSKPMISSCLAVLLLLGSPMPSLAEIPAVSPSDREQLEQLNARWLESCATRDSVTLASILADDFIGVYGQPVLSKAEMLASLVDGRAAPCSNLRYRLVVQVTSTREHRTPRPGA